MKNKLRSTILLLFLVSYLSPLQPAEQAIAAKDTQFLTDAILQYQATKYDAAKTDKEKKEARKNLLNLVLQSPPLTSLDSKITSETINDVNTDFLATQLSFFSKSKPENEREQSQDIATLKEINKKLAHGLNPLQSLYKKTTVQQSLNTTLKKALSEEYIPESLRTKTIKQLIKAGADIWSIELPTLTNDLKIQILENIQPEPDQAKLNRKLANAILRYNTITESKFLEEIITLEQQGASIDNFTGVIESKIIEKIKNDISGYKQQRFDDLLKKLKTKITDKENQNPWVFMSRNEKDEKYKNYTETEYAVLQTTEFINILETDLKSDFSVINMLSSDQIVEILTLYMNLSLNVSYAYRRIGGPTKIRQIYLNFTSFNVLHTLISRLDQSYTTNEFSWSAYPSLALFDIALNNSQSRNLATLALRSKTYDLAYALLQHGAQFSNNQQTLDDDIVLAQHFPTFVIFCQLMNTNPDQEIKPNYFSIKDALSMPGFDATIPLFTTNNLYYTKAYQVSRLNDFLKEKKSLIETINFAIQDCTETIRFIESTKSIKLTKSKETLEKNVKQLQLLLKQIPSPKTTSLVAKYLQTQEVKRADLTDILMNLL